VAPEAEPITLHVFFMRGKSPGRQGCLGYKLFSCMSFY
jgi:hypothetical protein